MEVRIWTRGSFLLEPFLFPSVRPASAPSPEDTVKGSATNCRSAPALRRYPGLLGLLCLWGECSCPGSEASSQGTSSPVCLAACPPSQFLYWRCFPHWFTSCLTAVMRLTFLPRFGVSKLVGSWALLSPCSSMSSSFSHSQIYGLTHQTLGVGDTTGCHHPP